MEISRDKSFNTLSKCIRCVHHGKIWVSNSELEYIFWKRWRITSKWSHVKMQGDGFTDRSRRAGSKPGGGRNEEPRDCARSQT